MKNLVFVLTLFICFNAKSQEIKIDSLTKKYYISEVFQADSITKSELFSNALEWFALTFNSSNDVLQLKDENNGKIIGKGILYDKTDKSKTYFTVSIYIKDYKFKYIFTDFITGSSENKYEFYYEAFDEQTATAAIKNQFSPIINELKKRLLSKQKKDNW